MLKELFNYEENSGKLYWKPRDRYWFNSDWAFKVWNKRYSNKEAFTTVVGGYRSGRILDKGYLAHRVILALKNEVWPEEVDHINGDPSDNCLKNLRNVTSSENSKNTKLHKHNTSGVCGVYWENYTKRWVASAESEGVRVKKRFSNEKDAIACRISLEEKMSFHENHGRR